MTRRMVLVLGLLIACGFAASQAQTWRMNVHKGAQTTVFDIADVDSITFHADLAPADAALVPAGTFVFGDGFSQCGRDEREVTLTHDFYLGLREVTNHQYIVAVQWAYDHGFVTATPAEVRDHLDGSTALLLNLDDPYCEIGFMGGHFSLRDAGYGIHPNNPVILVTWYGSARYCDWLSMQAGLPRAYKHSGDWTCNGGDPYGAGGYRLPTEAEWEFAAQYDDERLYPWGDNDPDCGLANCWFGTWYCVGWTAPVGGYPAAPAVLGLFDMAGNVWEWCNDWFMCDLGECPEIDPVGPATGGQRALRGGSWGDPWSLLRISNRVLYPPLEDDAEYSRNNVGFRVAMTASH